MYDYANNNSSWTSPSAMMGLISSYGTTPPVQANAVQAQAQAIPVATGLSGPTPGANPSAPGAPGVNPGSAGLGFNMGTASLALGGLQTIGGLWNAWEAQKLAKKQFAFQKDVTETNLKNQIQSYNTTLEDRGRSRAHTESQDSGTAQAYVDRNRLSR